jgi:hypothetical protein
MFYSQISKLKPISLAILSIWQVFSDENAQGIDEWVLKMTKAFLSYAFCNSFRIANVSVCGVIAIRPN